MLVGGRVVRSVCRRFCDFGWSIGAVLAARKRWDVRKWIRIMSVLVANVGLLVVFFVANGRVRAAGCVA